MASSKPRYLKRIMLSGYTVSDLHLFSDRSQGQRHLGTIERLGKQADLFVFNGDIFDFQWSNLPSQAETLAAAISWIETLINRNPHCVFIFLIGNHDAIPAYIESLRTLRGVYPNFHWKKYTLVIGNKLFLHGDALHGGTTTSGLETYRTACSRKSYSGIRTRLYESITHLGITVLAHKLVTSRSACSRILKYLQTSHRESLTGVTDIYFGHTHNALSNYLHEGIRFHNCGGPFTAMTFNIISFHCENSELEAGIH